MMRLNIKKIVKRQEAIVAIFAVLLFVFFAVFSDNFLTPKNVKLIFSQFSINGICVLGVAIVVILGGIDLSAGSILAVAGFACGILIKQNIHPVIAILASVIIGAFCGYINGVVVTVLGVPAIITTMATNYLFRGLLVIVTGGFWVNQFPKSFTTIATGRTLGMNNTFWMSMILLAGMSFLMHQLNIGRKIYAVGTNMEGADRCGIHAGKVMRFGYLMCGALIGFAGSMYAAQYGAVNPSVVGTNLGTTVLAAALAGGVNFGGRGTLVGGAIGMMMITIINNGLIQIKVSEYWIDAITGAIILVALLLNILNSKNIRKEEE